MMTAASRLAAGLSDQGLSLDSHQQQQLLTFIELMAQWNTRHNLTAINDPMQMVIRHLLDSLAPVSMLDQGPVLDIGSGAGLPGIPLAIAAPNVSFTLLDSSRKRTRFMQHVKNTLRLGNVVGEHSRGERYRAEPGFTQVWTRAFSSLDAMIAGSSHLLAPQGEFVALKGKVPHDELDAVAARVSDLRVDPLTVPGLNEERCVIRFSPAR